MNRFKSGLGTAAFGLLLLLFIALPSQAQKKISFDNLTDGTFRQDGLYGLNWMADGQYYSAQEGNNILRFDIGTGEIIENVLRGDDLATPMNFNGYEFSSDEKQLLLLNEVDRIYRRSYKGNYYVVNRTEGSVKPLSANGKQQYATFSPDGSKVAFVRENNLFYTDLSNMREVQITTDGKFNEIINGSSDWVYEEEFSVTRMFQWSPDGQHIAFVRFDETAVPQYNMQVWQEGKLYPANHEFKYPKAGEENATVSLHLYTLAGNNTRKVQLDNRAEDYYIPRLGWTTDNNLLSVTTMNRLQNQRRLYHINAQTAEPSLVLEETSNTYIDIDYCDDLTYLQDGEHFLYSSEKDGYKHLYLHRMNGELVRQLTNGPWEVSAFVGIDQSKRRPVLYYISTEDSPLERSFYSVQLDGKKKQKLSQEAGVNSVFMSPNFSYYIISHSSADNHSNGEAVRSEEKPYGKSAER